MSDKLVFIDRDGTINVDKGYVHKFSDFELIQGSLEALQLLTQQEVLIYIITNQAGIARGYYSEEDYYSFTEQMLDFFKRKKIKIADVLHCPHHPEGIIPRYKKFCSCRKPANGLLKKIIRKNKKISLNNMALIGDKDSDIKAGNSLGIKTYLVKTGHRSTEKLDTTANHLMPDLKTSVLHLLKSWALIKAKY